MFCSSCVYLKFIKISNDFNSLGSLDSHSGIFSILSLLSRCSRKLNVSLLIKNICNPLKENICIFLLYYVFYSLFLVTTFVSMAVHFIVQLSFLTLFVLYIFQESPSLGTAFNSTLTQISFNPHCNGSFVSFAVK